MALGDLLVVGGVGVVVVGGYLFVTKQFPDLSKLIPTGGMQMMDMGTDGMMMDPLLTDNEKKDLGMPTTHDMGMHKGKPDRGGMGMTMRGSGGMMQMMMKGGISPKNLPRVPIGDHTAGGFFGFPMPHRTGMMNRVALVRPDFTGAAYNDAFYSWYSCVGKALAKLQKSKLVPPTDRSPCPPFQTTPNVFGCHPSPPFKAPEAEHFTIGRIPEQTDSHPNSDCVTGKIYRYGHFSHYRVLDWVPHFTSLMGKIPNGSFQVVRETMIHAAPSGMALRNMFDVIVLGHSEYNTQKEYDNLRDFTQAGGTLVLLTGNVFCAKVDYLGNDRVQFVSGHGATFDKSTGNITLGAPFDYWYDETKQWAGCAFMHAPTVWFADPTSPGGMNWSGVGYRYEYNPLRIGPGEDNVLVNSNARIIMDYKAVYYAPPGAYWAYHNALPYYPKPLIGTWQLPSGSGQVICLGTFGTRGSGPQWSGGAFNMFQGNPRFEAFLDALLSNTAFVGASPMLKQYSIPA